MSRQRSETRPGGGGWDDDKAGAAVINGRIGRGIRIKGVVRGKEDLIVEGQVEGSISLPEHHVVLERPSRTSADVRARNATLRGRHRGNASASDKIEIAAEGCVIGDLNAPRLVIHEGARFRGKLDMDVELPADLLGSNGTAGASAEGGEARGSESRREHNSKKKGRHAE